MSAKPTWLGNLPRSYLCTWRKILRERLLSPGVAARSFILFPLALDESLGNLDLPYESASGFGEALLEGIRGSSRLADRAVVHLEQAAIAERAGLFNDAIHCYLEAIAAGLSDWRLAWAVAKAAEQSQNLGVLDTACAAVHKAKPEFFYARELPRQARGYYAQLRQDEVIEAFFLWNPPRHRFFVEVGAFDGVHFSNTRRLNRTYGWAGLCIEPVAKNYEKLARTYKGSNVACERLAVSLTEGEVEMNVSNMTGCPGWGSDVASLSDRHSERWLRAYDLQWTKQRVKSKPLTQILDNHNVAGVDLLSIDAEKHDLDVLNSLDARRYRPRMIVVEYGGQRRGILNWARRERYHVHHDNGQDWFLVTDDQPGDTP